MIHSTGGGRYWTKTGGMGGLVGYKNSVEGKKENKRKWNRIVLTQTCLLAVCLGSIFVQSDQLMPICDKCLVLWWDTEKCLFYLESGSVSSCYQWIFHARLAWTTFLLVLNIIVRNKWIFNLERSLKSPN